MVMDMLGLTVLAVGWRWIGGGFGVQCRGVEGKEWVSGLAVLWLSVMQLPTLITALHSCSFFLPSGCKLGACLGEDHGQIFSLACFGLSITLLWYIVTVLSAF